MPFAHFMLIWYRVRDIGCLSPVFYSTGACFWFSINVLLFCCSKTLAELEIRYFYPPSIVWIFGIFFAFMGIYVVLMETVQSANYFCTIASLTVLILWFMKIGNLFIFWCLRFLSLVFCSFYCRDVLSYWVGLFLDVLFTLLKLLWVEIFLDFFFRGFIIGILKWLGILFILLHYWICLSCIKVCGRRMADTESLTQCGVY